IDVSKASVGDVGTFKVQRDVEPAKGAIGKFVVEFNDAQDYVRSLVAVNNDGDKVTAGTFSSNIEISRLGSQLRKIVFGNSYAHSQSAITDDGADITLDVNTNDPTLNGGTSDVEQLGTDLGAALVTDYVVKVNADDSDNNALTLNPVAYYRWDGAKWVTHQPRFSAFRLADIGLDFGTGSDRLKVKNAAMLSEQLLENPDKVKALFGETLVESTKTAEAADEAVGAVTLNNKDPNNPTTTLASAAAGDLIANPLSKDNNTGRYQSYQGIALALNDFLGNFLTGDEDSCYKGAYKAHIDSLRSQNKRIDDRIEDMNRFLEQRENALSQSFIRMEEMQSKLNTQLQTLTNSFASSKK
ncbi:MAG: flagellar filament capping protein FliD, partial [Opitutales bacterium]